MAGCTAFSDTPKYHIKSTTFHLKYNIIIRVYIYIHNHIYIYTKEKTYPYIQSSPSVLSSSQLWNSPLLAPWISLRLGLAVLRHGLRCESLVARHSNPHALRGRRPRCKGCRSAGTLKSGSFAAKTAESRARFKWGMASRWEWRKCV